MVHNLNVIATAKSRNKAVDLVFKNIFPLNGIIKIRLKSAPPAKASSDEIEEAYLQALEVDRHLKGEGASPVTFGQ